MIGCTAYRSFSRGLHKPGQPNFPIKFIKTPLNPSYPQTIIQAIHKPHSWLPQVQAYIVPLVKSYTYYMCFSVMFTIHTSSTAGSHLPHRQHNTSSTSTKSSLCPPSASVTNNKSHTTYLNLIHTITN